MLAQLTPTLFRPSNYTLLIFEYCDSGDLKTHIEKVTLTSYQKSE